MRFYDGQRNGGVLLLGLRVLSNVYSSQEVNEACKEQDSVYNIIGHERFGS